MALYCAILNVRRCLVIIVKNCDESLTLQSLEAGLARIIENHPLSSALIGSYSARQAGIGGEDRVADIFCKHRFTMNHGFSTI